MLLALLSLASRALKELDNRRTNGQSSVKSSFLLQLWTRVVGSSKPCGQGFLKEGGFAIGKEDTKRATSSQPRQQEEAII